jgi:hypothetical protein
MIFSVLPLAVLSALLIVARPVQAQTETVLYGPEVLVLYQKRPRNGSLELVRICGGLVLRSPAPFEVKGKISVDTAPDHFIIILIR